MANPSLFKHKTPVQIRFKDADMMGHVNNANCFSYAEDARLKYFSDVTGKDSDWSRQDGLILGRFEIDFRQPIFYGDNISVLTGCTKIGTKSFDLSWQIVKENNSETGIAVLAEG